MKQPRSSPPRFRGAPVDLVVDVRSRIEYWLGHLPGAVCIPGEGVVESLAERVDITPSSRILVYCAAGTRSAAAVSELRAAGYRNVIDGGGMNAAWNEFTP